MGSSDAMAGAMKKAGLKPSNYFRFPGLRHNKSRLKELYAMGFYSRRRQCLAGQAAWWNKTVGGKIKPGSIILIHGNGNEQPGVVNEFIGWLKKNKKIRIVSLDQFMLAVFPPGRREAVQP
jgi:hypothetical protein